VAGLKRIHDTEESMTLLTISDRSVDEENAVVPGRALSVSRPANCRPARRLR